MPDNNCPCPQPESINVPITGITVPFCGFGVNIDASKLPKCECDIATPAKQGLVPAGGQAGQIYGVNEDGSAYGFFDPADRYDLCEFYYFRHPKLRPGFQPASGMLLEDAATRYPRAWEYLQSAEGQILCVSEEEWQAMTHAEWATLADGTKVGWEGIGGAPFYALHLDTGALRLPDLRGMYPEVAGFDGLAVGSVHGDTVRPIEGHFLTRVSEIDEDWYSGPFARRTSPTLTSGTAIGNKSPQYVHFDNSRVVPVSNAVKPRAWGVLACVYLGR